jgi:hypothetical protein
MNVFRFNTKNSNENELLLKKHKFVLHSRKLHKILRILNTDINTASNDKKSHSKIMKKIP